MTSKRLPPSLAKYFKITSKAARMLDPAGRVCDLDKTSYARELVYGEHESIRGIAGARWNEMEWSQAKLWQLAQRDNSVRISRVEITVAIGDVQSISRAEFLNEPERGMVWGTSSGMLETTLKVGFHQKRRGHFFLVSVKQ